MFTVEDYIEILAGVQAGGATALQILIFSFLNLKKAPGLGFSALIC